MAREWQMKKTFTFAFLIVLLFSSLFSVAAIPDSFTVTFRLLNDTGGPVNENINTTISVYDSVSGGSPLYNETKNVSYNVNGVGSFTLNSLNLPFDSNYYIEGRVGGELLSPRINVTPAPYSFFSNNATWSSNGSWAQGSLTSENSTYASGVDCADVGGTSDNICDDADTIYDDTGLVGNQTDFLERFGAVTENQTLYNNTFNDVIITLSSGNLTGVSVISGYISGTYGSTLTIPAIDAITSNQTSYENSFGSLTANQTRFNQTLDTLVEDGSAFNNTLTNIVGFSCSGNDFVNSFNTAGLPVCDTPAGGGGSGQSKWIDNGSFLSPNSSFADDVFIPGFINSTELCLNEDCTTSLPNASSTSDELQDLFSTISADGSSIEADSNGDTLTIDNGSGVAMFVDTSSDLIRLNHSDTSSQASSDNSDRTYIQDILLDGFGHITSITTATETVTDTDTFNTTEQIQDSVGDNFACQDNNCSISYNDGSDQWDVVVSVLTFSWDDLRDIPSGFSDGVDDDTFNTTEQMQDSAGLLVDGDTEQNITVDYDDANDQYDFVVSIDTFDYNDLLNTPSDSDTQNFHWTSSGNDLYNSSTSVKIGIRTDSPAEALHVASGNLTVEGNANFTGSIIMVGNVVFGQVNSTGAKCLGACAGN